MELYTLISLVIGVFGAAYAALNALRTNLESEINTAHDKCDGMVDAIIGKDRENGIIPHCQGHQKKIKTCRRVWRIANTIPAIMFFFLIALIVSWVLFDWEQVTAHHDGKQLNDLMVKFPWTSFRLLIGISGFMNIVCVVVAYFTYRQCKAEFKGLNAHHDGVKPKLPRLTQPGTE